MFKPEIRGPIWALILISLGGLGLHLKVHPPLEELINLVPALAGIFNVVVLPFLFNSAATFRWAYLANIATVIVGGVGMAYFSLSHWEGPVTLAGLLIRTTLPDIVILLARLPLGRLILNNHPDRGTG